MSVYSYTPAEQAIVASLASANGDAAKVLDEHFRAGRMSMAACMKYAAESAKPKKALQPVTFLVAQSGAISAYGLSASFPTTLYLSQWRRLFTAAGSDATAFEAWVATNPVAYFVTTGTGKETKHTRLSAEVGPTTPGVRVVSIATRD